MSKSSGWEAVSLLILFVSLFCLYRATQLMQPGSEVDFKNLNPEQQVIYEEAIASVGERKSIYKIAVTDDGETFYINTMTLTADQNKPPVIDFSADKIPENFYRDVQDAEIIAVPSWAKWFDVEEVSISEHNMVLAMFLITCLLAVMLARHPFLNSFSNSRKVAILTPVAALLYWPFGIMFVIPVSVYLLRYYVERLAFSADKGFT